MPQRAQSPVREGIDSPILTSVESGPSARLRGLVDRCSSYSETTVGVLHRNEPAGTRGVLVFNLGEPIEVRSGAFGAQTIRSGEGFVGGVFECGCTVTSRSSQEGIQVFAPLETFGRLLGVPLRELKDRVVPLELVLGAAARQLIQRLGECRAPERRLALLDGALASRLASAPAPDPRIPWVRRRLREPGVSVAALAAELGWSRRHLTRRFVDEVGSSPRTFARLARFERFVELLRGSSPASLADLALDAGYYDQPHLHGDVRRFAGLTPKELLVSRIPDGGGFLAPTPKERPSVSHPSKNDQANGQ